MAAAVLFVSSSAFSAEFLSNGALMRAAPGGNWCELSSNAFSCWTLTPDNGGGVDYSVDWFRPNTQVCGCGYPPCQIYPEISQTFGISNGGAYTFSWEQRNDQSVCSSKTTIWANMTAVGTVYYYTDASMLLPCNPDRMDTGNIVCSSQGAWTRYTFSGTAPSDCRYIKVAIKALSKMTNCTATGGYVFAWAEIRNVSFTSTAFAKTTGAEPTVTQNPSDKTATVGDQVRFSATATGAGALIYQWQKKPAVGSFLDIGGATSSSYTTPALAAGDNGAQYRCRVTDACGSVYTSAATVTVLSPLAVDTVAAAKALPDGTFLKLTGKAVSARTGMAYWVQDADPPSGIRINSTLYPSPGTLVTVSGNLTTVARERQIVPVLETTVGTAAATKPVFLTTRAMGGAKLNDYSLGVTDGYGPNNIGLLVKIYGTVRNIGSSYYYLDDGVGLRDGTTTNSMEDVGVRIVAPHGALEADDTASATGVISTFANGPDVRPSLVLPGCFDPDAGLAVTAVPSTICEGDSTTITVAATEPDVSYQLRDGSVHVGNPVMGTGGTIYLPTGVLSQTTTFNVLATRSVGGCSVQLGQTRTVVVNPLPNAGLAVSAQQTQLSVGQSTNITVAGSQAGINYQLRNNVNNSNIGAPVAGTGGTISLPTGVFSSSGNYGFNVLASNASSGCGLQLSQTVVIVVGPAGTITGRVLNARAEPLSGAVVALSNGVCTATTSWNGYFTMSNVAVGTYSLTASAPTYQAHTWERLSVTANSTLTAPSYYLPHTWSKIGWHVQYNNVSLQDFLSPIYSCGKTCQLIKGIDLSAAATAAQLCPGSFTVGRIIDDPTFGTFEAYNNHLGESPQAVAYNAYQVLKTKWQANPNVNVWEVTNEWDAHYDWQSDFFLAMMDLAEQDGFRIACFSSSYGTPSLSPTYKFPGDTRTVRENVARVCARAKAHGGHMLALHEYAPGGTLQQWYLDHGNDIVLRYRQWHDYLKTYDEPANGYVGADCPIIITECAGDCSAGVTSVVNDMAWYDSMVRQDSYLLGVATWNVGIGAECDCHTAFGALAAYECSVN